MMTGTSKTRITDLLLRHWVLKSALNRQDNAVEVDGIIVSIFIKFYARTVRPVRPINTSSSVILPFLDTLTTSGLFR